MSIRKPNLPFNVCSSDGAARTGTLHLTTGEVQTPVFMPVGTQASVKAVGVDDLEALGAEIVLGNTYHLMQRPGDVLISELGGLGKFMGWHRPTLTDSGGYQIYSLARKRKLSEQGVEFRSHVDGSLQRLSPESAIETQIRIGADIIMPLDVCAGFDTTDTEQQQAAELTHSWLPRNITTFDRRIDRTMIPRKLLFGIAQGGFDTERRRHSARFIASQDVDGSAIGGLSVGEPKEIMAEMLSASVEPLPWNRPRYLMGVGSPEDLWNAVAQGIDMFDCVLPTRVGRHGSLYTPTGRINLKGAAYRSIDEAVDVTCDCLACKSYSTAYLHHLFRTKEPLALRLASIHNLRFLVRQINVMRAAIASGTFQTAHRRFISSFNPVDPVVSAAQRKQYFASTADSRSKRS